MIIKYLIKCYRIDKNLDDNAYVESKDFIQWMEDTRREKLCASTYSKYKTAIIKHFGDLNLKKLFTKKAPRKSSVPIRTSRKRAKKISREDMQTIAYFAENVSKSKWATVTKIWLSSSVNTGLRPHEWCYCKMTDDEKYLVVQNIKLEKTIYNFEGVAKRYVPIEHLSQEDRNDIKAMIVTAGDIGVDGYPYLYQMCAQWLTKANLKLFKRRAKTISLMSPRHQYMANLKQSGLTPTEIAYIVGHHCDDRAYESYGSRRNGCPLNISGDYIPVKELAKVVMKIEAKWSKRNQIKPHIQNN